MLRDTTNSVIGYGQVLMVNPMKRTVEKGKITSASSPDWAAVFKRLGNLILIISFVNLSVAVAFQIYTGIFRGVVVNNHR